MKTTVHPLFGNLQIETRPDSVALALRTNRNGLAVFTYREIEVLAAMLSRLAGNAPVAETPVQDDDEDAMSLV